MRFFEQHTGKDILAVVSKRLKLLDNVLKPLCNKGAFFSFVLEPNQLGKRTGPSTNPNL
jgi:hypothetical protein